MNGTCPRCGRAIEAAPDESGVVTCLACGAQLRRATPPTADRGAPLQILLSEVQALRRIAEESLAILRSGAAGLESGHAASEGMAPSPQPIRHRRKTVLLVDDDEATRRAAVVALEAAQVPVRAAAAASECLAIMADEMPDVLVLEMGLSDPMPGKDLINMIKATMEWIHIPIVLYSRLPIVDDTEAQTIHGADAFVPKGSGGPEALLARVIRLFQSEGGS